MKPIGLKRIPETHLAMNKFSKTKQEIIYLQRKIENFKLENTILQFDFSIFSLFKELQPFTIEIPVSDE